jgi:hypothetical protein
VTVGISALVAALILLLGIGGFVWW